MSAPSSTECYHCGLPVPQGSHYEVEIDGESRAMCCRGCQAVAQAIVDGGLVDYYRYRTETPKSAKDLVPEALKELDLYDRPDLQQSFVHGEGAEVREASLILEGIVCAACVWLNERHVNALPGVLEFRVNYATHRAQLRWDDSQIHLSDILKAIAAIGYIAHPFDPGRQEALFKQERKLAMRRIAVAGLGAMQVMMLATAMYYGDYSGMEVDIRAFMRWVSLVIAAPVLLYSAQPFFTAAWRDLRRRQLGMDVPVALAVGAAFLASAWATIVNHGEIYYDSATMFTFFLLSGRYLEMMARHRAGQAADDLVRLTPAVATRLSDNGTEEVVAVAELRPGDRVLVRPGETLPADGHVTEGRSSVDESVVTGESMPRGKASGDEVIGGSVNVESPLTVIVEKVGADTVLSAIIRLLDRAQTEKPSLARLADRVAAWFVGALLILAAGIAFYWWQHAPDEAFRITLSVLVVTCPCALSLATPAAVTAASGALTRLGLLTTRGHALEALARATHIVFDKTGTLTLGRLQLAEVRAERGLSRERVLALAAALERGSEHPVGRVLAVAGQGLGAEALEATPGQGVEGHIEGARHRVGSPSFVAGLSGIDITAPVGSGTEVWLGDEAGLLARFRLVDELRPEAPAALAALRRAGLQVELLSGDAPAEVARVAESLGLVAAGEDAGKLAHGGQRPEDKLARIRALQAEGAVVAMVGDGVNDAPVLAGADVSLAMGGGTQLAQASADMILLSENLSHLAIGVRTARRTLGVIRQNLGWAVLYNVVAVPLAAAGHVAPWMAAIGMSASSLLVVLNALRLTRVSGLTAAAPGGAKDASRAAADRAAGPV
ncbi:MAG TPA: heavy metal translocating P-type ATPase [Gammaproteobacteria bacterium]|nr:heavy metal translocating P-type ATPase [Gammaproteobacteria bacterium]